MSFLQSGALVTFCDKVLVFHIMLMKTYNCEFMQNHAEKQSIKSTVEYSILIQFLVQIENSHQIIFIFKVSKSLCLFAKNWDKVIDSYRTVHV